MRCSQPERSVKHVRDQQKRSTTGPPAARPSSWSARCGATLGQVEASLGLREIICDVDSQDWHNAGASAIRQAAARLTNGQIIRMHDWPQNTISAQPGILPDLQARNPCPGHISAGTGRAVAPAGGGGGCTVSVSRAEERSDRFK